MRRTWVESWLLRGNNKSLYQKLVNDLRLADRGDFRRFMKMNTETFEVRIYLKTNNYMTVVGVNYRLPLKNLSSPKIIPTSVQNNFMWRTFEYWNIIYLITQLLWYTMFLCDQSLWSHKMWSKFERRWYTIKDWDQILWSQNVITENKGCLHFQC